MKPTIKGMQKGLRKERRKLARSRRSQKDLESERSWPKNGFKDLQKIMKRFLFLSNSSVLSQMFLGLRKILLNYVKESQAERCWCRHRRINNMLTTLLRTSTWRIRRPGLVQSNLWLSPGMQHFVPMELFHVPISKLLIHMPTNVWALVLQVKGINSLGFIRSTLIDLWKCMWIFFDQRLWQKISTRSSSFWPSTGKEWWT